MYWSQPRLYYGVSPPHYKVSPLQAHVDHWSSKTLLGLVTSYPGFLACRFFVGLFEGVWCLKHWLHIWISSFIPTHRRVRARLFPILVHILPKTNATTAVGHHSIPFLLTLNEFSIQHCLGFFCGLTCRSVTLMNCTGLWPTHTMFLLCRCILRIIGSCHNRHGRGWP